MLLVGDGNPSQPTSTSDGGAAAAGGDMSVEIGPQPNSELKETATSNAGSGDKLIDKDVAAASLRGLSDFVEKDQPPSEEDSKNYLAQVALLQKTNSEMQFLNILDEIIDLTMEGKIGQAELETDIPNGIIAVIREGDFATEYIHSSITKKWILSCFQGDSDNYEVSVKSDTLVQVVDKEKQTFDLFGLYVQYSLGGRRNRISPEYVAKEEPVNPKPRQVGKYSAFRGGQVVKTPLVPVLPKVPESPQPQAQPPQAKVSGSSIIFQ